MSEFYAQDDQVVTVEHVGSYRWTISCTCRNLAEKADAESVATEIAMGHILEHDAAYEAACEAAENADDDD